MKRSYRTLDVGALAPAHQILKRGHALAELPALSMPAHVTPIRDPPPDDDPTRPDGRSSRPLPGINSLPDGGSAIDPSLFPLPDRAPFVTPWTPPAVPRVILRDALVSTAASTPSGEYALTRIVAAGAGKPSSTLVVAWLGPVSVGGTSLTELSIAGIDAGPRSATFGGIRAPRQTLHRGSRLLSGCAATQVQTSRGRDVLVAACDRSTQELVLADVLGDDPRLTAVRTTVLRAPVGQARVPGLASGTIGTDTRILVVLPGAGADFSLGLIEGPPGARSLRLTDSFPLPVVDPGLFPSVVGYFTNVGAAFDPDRGYWTLAWTQAAAGGWVAVNAVRVDFSGRVMGGPSRLLFGEALASFTMGTQVVRNLGTREYLVGTGSSAWRVRDDGARFFVVNNRDVEIPSDRVIGSEPAVRQVFAIPPRYAVAETQWPGLEFFAAGSAFAPLFPLAVGGGFPMGAGVAAYRVTGPPEGPDGSARLAVPIEGFGPTTGDEIATIWDTGPWRTSAHSIVRIPENGVAMIVYVRDLFRPNEIRVSAVTDSEI